MTPAARRETAPGARVSEIPELRGLQIVRRLSGGGGWNDTWLAVRGDERLVVRLDRPAVGALGLNRAAERDVLGCVQGRGIAPEIVFCDIRRGVLVSRWLPGQFCTGDTVRNPRFLGALGAILRRLHETVSAPPGMAPLGLARAAGHYALLVGGVSARRAAQQANRSLRAAGGNHRRAVLCHNDPVAQNILRGPAMRLIDWEFAAPGDPLFDPAVVIGHHRLDPQRAHVLLAAARGRAHPSDRRALIHLVDCYTSLRTLWEAAVRVVVPRFARASPTPRSTLPYRRLRIAKGSGILYPHRP